MDEAAPRYASLGDYLRLLRTQWLVILVPTVLAVAAALAYSLHQTPSYQAEAQVQIQDESQQLSLLGTPVPTSTAPTGPAIVAQTASTPRLARAVRHSLRTRIPAAVLMGAISLSVDPATGLLDVTATSPKAGFSAKLANAYATQIAGETTRSVHHQFATAGHVLQRRLGQLNPTASGDAGERATLEDEISRLQFLQATSTPGQVARAAVAPGAPTSPNPARNAGLGLAVGLLIGLIAAFVRDGLDGGKMRRSSDISDKLGLRVLGQVRGTALGQTFDPARAERNGARVDVEAFRILRDNVELLTSGSGEGVVLVTSSLPEEGKSTVAASLARASAAAGRRTLLIEADLRRPALAKRLGIRTAPGLTEYLVGKVESGDVIHPVPGATDGSANGNGGESNGRSAGSQLACIPAGYPQDGAAELLSSPRMGELLTEVASAYDLVIVDSAPLLPVADTRRLLGLANAVVLCVRAGRTTEEQLRESGAALARVPADAAGVVVTDARAGDAPSGHGVYATFYGGAERPAE
jgi:receptor protein-tyrosine kinase